MSCETYREWIALGQYGELSPEERRTLETHLAACEGCREVERAYSGVVALLRRSSPRPASGSQPPAARAAIPRRRLREPWLSVAAAVLVLGVAVFLAWSARPQPIEVVRGGQETPNPQADPRAAIEVRLAGIERATRALLPVSDEDFLADLTASSDPLVAVRAVAVLGRRGTPRAEKALRAALARPETRPAAFDALEELGRIDPARDAIPALADAALRHRAAEVLLARGTAPCFQALLSRAVAGDRVCLAACRAFPPQAALPAIRASLVVEASRATAIDLLLGADGDPYRQALLEAARLDAGLLHAAIARAEATLGESRSAAFLALALGDPALGPTAMEALASTPVRRLRGALSEGVGDPTLRSGLVCFLVARADELAARDLLVEALAHADVRGAAGKELLARGDLRAVAPLLRGGTSEDLDALSTLPAETRRREASRALRTPATRVAALRLVGEGDSALWRDVLPFLRDGRWRREALAALARASVWGAVPYIIPYVSRTEEGREAREALVAIVGEDFGEDPREWKAWWRSRTN